MSVGKSGANLMIFGSDQMDKTDKNHSYRSDINSNHPIFIEIKKLFESADISDYKISKIYKNNNYWLLKLYESHLDIISQFNNTSKSENERFLWHGSCKKCVEPILNKGYNRNYGVKMVHGIGTYFAVSPRDAMSYTSEDNDGVRYLLVNRCIVGRSCIGYDGDKEPSDSHCDSMTDKVLNPQQFCIPTDFNIYPSYLLEVVEAQKIIKRGNKMEQQQHYKRLQQMFASTNNNDNKSMDDMKNNNNNNSKKKRDRSVCDGIDGIDGINDLKQPPKKKQKVSHQKESEISKEEKRKRKRLLVEEKLKLSSKKDKRESFDDKAPSNNVPIENEHFTVKSFEECPGYKLFICSRCDKVVDSYHAMAEHIRCKHFTSTSVAESRCISGEWFVWEHSELNTDRFSCILCSCSSYSSLSTSKEEKTWATSRGVMLHAKHKHNAEWLQLD